MSAYYNEIDPYCAQWLRNLIAAGHIAPGDVDERSIEDVRPDELAGYTQCHFFAGIGVWSLALRAAGWPDSRRAWTGSCPCQPFSAAGKGAGFADERHLWPAWQHLIAQCRPSVVFGEQVASKAVEPWIDLVHADMEGMGYAFGCIPFPSAGVGAPHIRDRAYWVADADGARSLSSSLDGVHRCEDGAGAWHGELERSGAAIRLADANGRNASAERQQRGGEQRQQPQDGGARGLANTDGAGCLARQLAAATAGHRSAFVADGDVRGMADANGITCGQGRAFDGRRHPGCDAQSRPGPGGSGLPHGDTAGPTNGHWRDADWLLCKDGKWRPVEPGTFPLAHGAPGRVGRLRAYGNAINAQAAQAFIESYCEARGIAADRLQEAA